MSALSARSAALLDEMDDHEDDEDEETLQLKLQEIQARLRLKKLQSAKEKSAGPLSPRRRTPPPPQQRPSSTCLGFGASRAASRPEPQPAIEVPVSPVRRAQPTQPQISPSRVLLGIDKGLKAKDISLKRAPSVLRTKGNSSQEGQQQQFGPYLQRSRTPALQSAANVRRPLSFNERLAAARTRETDRQDLKDRVQRVRSHTFSIGQKEIDQFKAQAVDLPEQPEVAPQFTREEILGQQVKTEEEPKAPGALPALPEPLPKEEDDSQGLYEPPPEWMLPGKKPTKVAPADVPEAEASAFEPYSSFHLSQRILPHQVLTRHLSGKKIFKLPELLRRVKAPEFQLPDIEQDIVVFAIVAKKSDPRSHKPRPDQNGIKQSERGKYMVITLCDLKWDLELFLFNSGFTRFWKVTEGTVLAILNPTIMPPPVGREATGRFSLVINSDADTIIEVGRARDLGFCKSIKKDGEYCNSWVNKKRTEFCEFHTNEAITKQRATRMEVNSMDFGGIGERHRWNSRPIREQDVVEQRKGKYDKETHSHWFATRSMSSAQLIDGAQALADRREKEEGLKKRMLLQERERGIMQRLSKIGAGAGREYMKRTERGLASGAASAAAAAAPFSAAEDSQKLDANALGLMAPRSKDLAIHLSPIKRKRPQSAQSSSSTSGGGGGGSSSTSLATSGAKPGLGWGGSLKDKLAKMKEGEKLSNDKPPVRKKTRFVTEKGIREAGRESLGMVDLPQTVSFEDDDDDLVILR